jgi:hypothetical protein
MHICNKGGFIMETRLMQTMKAVAVATLVSGICLPSAEAIPANQRDVDLTSVSTGVLGSFQIIPNTSVTVNKGSIARLCIIRFSTELLTEIGDAVRLRSRSVDSTNPTSCANSQAPEDVYSATHDRLETRTVNWIRPIGAGTHTIRVCALTFDINASVTAATTIGFRTLTVECRTQ